MFLNLKVLSFSSNLWSSFEWTVHEIIFRYKFQLGHTVSICGRHLKGRERGETSAWSARRLDAGGLLKGTPARTLLFSSFCPLINYAKHTQLWNVWLSKLSNQNHATSFVTKSVGTNEFSYFLRENKFEDLQTLGKARRGWPKKKAIVTMFVEFVS